MIDGTKTGKGLKLYWAHLMQIIRGVGKSRATQWICNLRECGAQRQRAKAWLQGHGKSGHLSDRLCQNRHHGGTLPLPLVLAILLPAMFHF